MNQAKAPSLSSRLKNFIPTLVTCFKEGYTFSIFKSDFWAGLSVGMISFPLAMAYAIGANIPPERGLFTAIVGGFLISALGGSRVQIGGPTSTFIVVLYSIILRHGFDGMIIAALMGGIILIIFGLVGLGAYIKYIPYPVVTGLTTGIAVVIFTTQIKDFFGLPIESLSIDFLGKWGSYFKTLHLFDPKTVLISGGTLAILIYFRRKNPRFPASVVAIALSAFIVWAFDLNIDTINSRYGQIPRDFPTPSLPHFTFDQLMVLIPDALTIALLASIESLLSAVVAEGMTGWRHKSNCELVACGVANIGSILFGGIPAAGAVARTATNIKSGAKTPIAGMLHAVVVLVIMVSFAPYVGYIPLASLAAVLILIAWNISEIHHFLHLFTAPKKDVVVLLTVFAMTVLVGITSAVQVGMILAAFLFMKQMSDLSDVVSVAKLIDDQSSDELAFIKEDPDTISRKDVPQGIEVYEVNGPLFFGVADKLKNVFNQIERPPQIFILRMRKVPTIDASGMHALEELFLECKRQGTVLLLSGVKRAPLRDLQRFHFDQMIGKEHIFSHVNSALDYAKSHLQRKVGLNFTQECKET